MQKLCYGYSQVSLEMTEINYLTDLSLQVGNVF